MKAIILKFDDINLRTNVCVKWNAVINYILMSDVKASGGIIGSCLSDNNQKLFDWIKSINSTGKFEFWNHGFTHKKSKECTEFFGTTIEEQCNSIRNTQTLGYQKLGITFSTFGAPYNRIDINTETALKTFKEIKICFGERKIDSIHSIGLNKSYEKIYTSGENYNFFDFTFDSFKRQYNQLDKNISYEILQFHPGGWKNENTFREFCKIVDFLKEKTDTKFMTPAEYASYICDDRAYI